MFLLAVKRDGGAGDDAEVWLGDQATRSLCFDRRPQAARSYDDCADCIVKHQDQEGVKSFNSTHG